MGQCCTTPSNHQGEDYINMILNNENFYLQNIKYSQLKKTLDSFPKEIYSSKEKLRAELGKILFNNDQHKNKFYHEHSGFVNELFISLPPNPSSNTILFMLYPYMNHKGEDVEEILFTLFSNEVKGDFDYNAITELLDNYVENVTIKLTFAFWYFCQNSELKNAFDEMNSSIFTNENKNKYIDSILIGLKNYCSEEKDISKEMFVKNMSGYSLGSYQDIRHSIYVEYGF